MRKILIFFVLCTMFYVLSRIATYWYADVLYAQKDYSGAINLEPNQPLYRSALAVANSDLSESGKAIDLAPNNPVFKRSRFSIFIKLSRLLEAKNILLEMLTTTPTDPKLYYNLGLVYARLNEIDKAVVALQKAIELKPNYQEPKTALEYIK